MIETKRLVLKEAAVEFDQALLDYVTRNKAFLEEWVPRHTDDFYTVEHQRNILEDTVEKQHSGSSHIFYIFLKDDNTKIIGKVGVFNIVRGAFQSCHMGYSLDKDHINQGLMSEAVSAIVDFAFSDVHLHRVEANIVPKNIRSQRVLEKNGFVNEGISKDYLLIDGKWENHIHMVKLNEDY